MEEYYNGPEGWSMREVMANKEKAWEWRQKVRLGARQAFSIHSCVTGPKPATRAFWQGRMRAKARVLSCSVGPLLGFTACSLGYLTHLPQAQHLKLLTYHA